MTIGVRRRVVDQTSAPNVIGVLEGSDPQLKSEYVFFTGHMDHIGVVGGGAGCSASGADSICNGADDDASGTIGVVELAKAFASLNPRPRRSLVFMTVSGEERGLWGSGYYASNPEVPLAQTVADLNMDMIGRYYDNRPGWRDTIVVIGKEHSSLGEVANRVTREHPEIRMQLIDDIWPTENFYRRSDHFNFARKGVPILFFFNGTHPDYHRATDSVDKVDAEKEARIVRMVFYIGLEVANTTARPQWNPESRRQIVEAGN
jgi:Zn-dependent M28 family amino/carboxypeptidase